MCLTPRCLQQGKGITGDRPQLVLIPLADYVAAQAGVAQGQVDALEPAVLHPVIHPQIPFPLAVGTAYGGIHIIPTQVGGGGLEARYPGIGEVIGVAGQPGFFTGALELADLRVGDQVGGSTVAIVDEGEVAVATQMLVTQTEAVTAVAVGEQGAERPVVHLAIVLEPCGAIARLAVVVGAMGVAVEGAQVGIELALAQADVVHQAEEVLTVVVFQLGKVVAGNQVIGQPVVATGKAELVNPAGATGDGEFLVIGGVAALGLVDLAEMQGQAADVFRGELTATESLRQQASVVESQHRQLGLQRADTQFSLGNARLAGKVDTAEVADRAAVVFQRKDDAGVAATVGLAGATTGVQPDTDLAQYIQTKADRAWGIAGLEVQQKALPPFLALGRGCVAAAVVLIDIEVARAKGGAGAFDKAFLSLGQDGQGGGQQAEGDGAGQQSVLHDVLRLFIRVVMGVSSGSAWSSGALTVGIK